MAGLGVANSACGIEEVDKLSDSFPAIGSSSDAFKFLGGDMKHYEEVMKYLEGVSKGSVDIDRFACADVNKLAKNCQELKNHNSPYPRPIWLTESFGKFIVPAIDAYAAHVQRFNKGKAKEYNTLYMIASYLYEVAVQMFYGMHTPELSGNFVKAYAL